MSSALEGSLGRRTARGSSQISSRACRRRPPALAAKNPTTTTTTTAAAAANAATPATPPSTTTTPAYTRATLRTTDACELAVSIYPFFRYKAGGGGGDAEVTPAVAVAAASPSSSPAAENLLALSFDASTLRIPALDYRTAFLFGVLPIPPPLRIAIEPRELRGTLDPRTGACELAFDAEFRFAAGPLYRAPPLRVRTTLTTAASAGARLSGSGRAWDARTSSVRLAGVASVPKTGDAFLDAFLMLPNDALAVLEGELELR
jgi:hypothetical protein